LAACGSDIGSGSVMQRSPPLLFGGGSSIGLSLVRLGRCCRSSPADRACHIGRRDRQRLSHRCLLGLAPKCLLA
jgi:hypothetical protein